ncbi:MAG: PAS domain S-box protein [Synergistota bacterium]|nr:PAS domain S-box protein [Synergistota bacterium]
MKRENSAGNGREQLERQAKFTEKLLEILPVPVFYEDVQGRYLGCSRAFADFMGREEDEILGGTIFDIVGRDRAEQHFERDRKMIAEGRNSLVEERQMLHSDGTFHDTMFYKALIREDDEITGLIGAFFDITDRKKAEEREREYLERLRKLTYALSVTQERERRQMAMEIHDSIGQNLAISKLKLRLLGDSIDSPEAKAEIDSVVATLDETMKHTRSRVFNLGLPVLYQFGLEQAILCLKDDFKKKHGLAISLTSDPLPQNLDDNLKAFIFRTVQELLVNVVKHAGTDEAHICLSLKNGRILLDVSDNGRGFDLSGLDEACLSENSYGLFSLRTMVSLMGGVMEIRSKPGDGTWIGLSFPVEVA